MSKNKKDILDSFNKLRFILYKKKYLIPQRPFPGPKLRLCAIKNPMNIIEKYYPHLKTEDLIRRHNYDKQTLFKLLQTQIKSQQQNYKRRKQQYKKDYIDALKPIGNSLKPPLVFFQQKKSQIFNQKSKKGFKSMELINRLYGQLSIEEKKRYQQITEKLRAQKLRILTEAKAKYMIPQKQFVDPHILYLRDLKEGTFTPKEYHLFKELNEAAKHEYYRKSVQLYNLDVTNLLTFLASRGLTYESYQYIKSISQMYYSFMKNQKKSKTQKQLSIETDSQQVQNNTQQTQQK